MKRLTALDGEDPNAGGTGMALRVAAGEAPDPWAFDLARVHHNKRIVRFTGG